MLRRARLETPQLVKESADSPGTAKVAAEVESLNRIGQNKKRSSALHARINAKAEARKQSIQTYQEFQKRFVGRFNKQTNKKFEDGGSGSGDGRYQLDQSSAWEEYKYSNRSNDIPSYWETR